MANNKDLRSLVEANKELEAEVTLLEAQQRHEDLNQRLAVLKGKGGKPDSSGSVVVKDIVAGRDAIITIAGSSAGIVVGAFMLAALVGTYIHPSPGAGISAVGAFLLSGVLTLAIIHRSGIGQAVSGGLGAFLLVNGSGVVGALAVALSSAAAAWGGAVVADRLIVPDPDIEYLDILVIPDGPVRESAKRENERRKRAAGLKDVCPGGSEPKGSTCVAIVCGEGLELKGKECDVKKCPDGLELRNGTCTQIACPEGQRLNARGCEMIVCPKGQELRGSACEIKSCPKGQEMKGDTCEVIVCSESQELTADGCKEIRCPGSQQLKDGKCLGEPQATLCPRGMAFIAGTGPEGFVNNDEWAGGGVLQIVSDFCFDITEVTVAAYSKCVGNDKCEPALKTTHKNQGVDLGYDVEDAKCNANRSDRQRHPVNCVDLAQANAFCRAAGKRLPTEWEWEWAARGRDEARPFPWGKDALSCSRLVFSDGGCSDGTMPVGSKPDGNSRDKIKDLAGNVEEWTSSSYNVRTSITRGGGFWTHSSKGFGTADRTDVRPDNRLVELGFRCASKPFARPVLLP